MRMDKLIWKTVISTLVATLVLLTAMFGILSLFFPQTMMKITYTMGMDKASVNFSETAYQRYGVVDYVGYGADVALGAGLHSQAETFLEKLIADDEFESYCEKKNERLTGEQANTTLQAYYRRQLCLSILWQGDGERAVNRSLELMGDSFAAGNPLVEVILFANRLDGADGEATVLAAYTKLAEIKDSDRYGRYSAADKAYFDQVFAAVGGWLS